MVPAAGHAPRARRGESDRPGRSPARLPADPCMRLPACGSLPAPSCLAAPVCLRLAAQACWRVPAPACASLPARLLAPACPHCSPPSARACPSICPRLLVPACACLPLPMLPPPCRRFVKLSRSPGSSRCTRARGAPHWRNAEPGQHIQQRRHPDIGGIQGLASISSRGVTQTLEKYKAWPAYPAEVSPRHWRNTKPVQHIHQR